MVPILRFVPVIGLLVVLVATASPALAATCSLLDDIDEYVCSSETDPAESAQFVTPVPPDDTLFGRRWYGRLADNANVYAEPNRSAPIVRNVGDGFLYATINRWFDNEAGEAWYEINANEYVHGDDIAQVEPSDFQGIRIIQQPERPFGWVVQDLIPSREPVGAPDDGFAELPRFTFVEVYDAILGEDNWLWYDIGDGRWAKQTYFSLVDVNPRPEEVGEGEFWTEVDLYEQTFAAYEGDQMVYATLISSGLNNWPTYDGSFQVEQRFNEHKMSGAEGQVDFYFIEDIPYIMYFDMFNSIALHGTYWHDRFGYKHSHGCVNMPIKDAEWTFNWSASAPNDLWVWVHTSNPMAHLE